MWQKQKNINNKANWDLKFSQKTSEKQEMYQEIIFFW